MTIDFWKFKTVTILFFTDDNFNKTLTKILTARFSFQSTRDIDFQLHVPWPLRLGQLSSELS